MDTETLRRINQSERTKGNLAQFVSSFFQGDLAKIIQQPPQLLISDGIPMDKVSPGENTITINPRRLLEYYQSNNAQQPVENVYFRLLELIGQLKLEVYYSLPLPKMKMAEEDILEILDAEIDLLESMEEEEDLELTERDYWSRIEVVAEIWADNQLENLKKECFRFKLGAH